MFLKLLTLVVVFYLCHVIETDDLNSNPVTPRALEIFVDISLGVGHAGRKCGLLEIWYDKFFCCEHCNHGLKCYDGGTCFCKPGYKRHGNGCVSSCPSDTTCPPTMVLSSCPRCAEYCNPTDNTQQPRCDYNLRERRLSCENDRKYCVCPRSWKWYNGACVENCPMHDCGDNGLVYHKCYNDEWQKCYFYFEGNLTTKIDRDNCYSGCFCPKNLYYINQRCLDGLYCPIGDGKCQPGMEYVTYTSLFSRRCNSLNCPSLHLPTTVYEGCSCVRGTYFNSVTKKCVGPKQCLSNLIGYCPFEHTEFTKKKPSLNYCEEGEIEVQTNKEIIGCFCVAGYLYDESVCQCVPKEECGGGSIHIYDLDFM